MKKPLSGAGAGNKRNWDSIKVDVAVVFSLAEATDDVERE